jgi:hypothetical protein
MRSFSPASIEDAENVDLTVAMENARLDLAKQSNGLNQRTWTTSAQLAARILS